MAFILAPVRRGTRALVVLFAKHRSELRENGLPWDGRLAPSHDLNPPMVRVREKTLSRSDQVDERQRDCDIRDLSDVERAAKGMRRDAYDRRRDAVDLDAPSDDGRIAPEPPVPVPMRDHRDRFGAWLIVRRSNRSSETGTHSKHIVVAAAYELSLDDARIIAVHQGYFHWGEREQAR